MAGYADIGRGSGGGYGYANYGGIQVPNFGGGRSSASGITSLLEQLGYGKMNMEAPYVPAGPYDVRTGQSRDVWNGYQQQLAQWKANQAIMPYVLQAALGDQDQQRQLAMAEWAKQQDYGRQKETEARSHLYGADTLGLENLYKYGWR